MAPASMTAPITQSERYHASRRMSPIGTLRSGCRTLAVTIIALLDASCLNLLCALFCQGAFGLGGQDWVERHRLVAGSYEVTPPWRVAGGVDRSIRGQHRDGASAGYWVRLHPPQDDASVDRIWSAEVTNETATGGIAAR